MSIETPRTSEQGDSVQRQTKLVEAVNGKPRYPLAQLPTPLDDAPRLSERLGIRTLIKRDDQTGLALGGNKARKLEFLIGDALFRRADTIVTTGGSQSNHARMTAAACRRAGLKCCLVLDRGIHPESQGNLLLDQLFGADVKIIESSNPADAITEMKALAGKLEAEGRTPYIILRGGSTPPGATGYALAAAELAQQIALRGEKITHIYLVTGSAGTHAGVMAGITALGWDVKVQGISVSRTASEQRAQVTNLANLTLAHLGYSLEVESDCVRVDDRYRGSGYGRPTDDAMDAILYAARDEGILLDPVYTAKCMAGLAGHAQEGRFGSGDIVVFVHTGGAPALFAYHAELRDLLDGSV